MYILLILLLVLSSLVFTFKGNVNINNKQVPMGIKKFFICIVAELFFILLIVFFIFLVSIIFGLFGIIVSFGIPLIVLIVLISIIGYYTIYFCEKIRRK